MDILLWGGRGDGVEREAVARAGAVCPRAARCSSRHRRAPGRCSPCRRRCHPRCSRACRPRCPPSSCPRRRPKRRGRPTAHASRRAWVSVRPRPSRPRQCRSRAAGCRRRAASASNASIRSADRVVTYARRSCKPVVNGTLSGKPISRTAVVGFRAGSRRGLVVEAKFLGWILLHGVSRLTVGSVPSRTPQTLLHRSCLLTF
jgi:hypothetical protein